jgi:hypothetical protein
MAAQDTPTMQLAEILSDLVSLRVCVRPHTPLFSLTNSHLSHLSLIYLLYSHPNKPPKDPKASLALVSARPNTTNDPTAAADDDQDADLKRAKDLLKLHYEVKEAHKRGELGRGLEEARRAVGKAVGG